MENESKVVPAEVKRQEFSRVAALFTLVRGALEAGHAWKNEDEVSQVTLVVVAHLVADGWRKS